MVQCEMCGAETASPNTVRVEGAELDVCDDCTDFGTEVREESTSSASTKYSTSSGSSGSSGGGGTTTRSSRSSGGGRSPGSDMLDDVEELATDYDDRIRAAREDAGLSQDDLAKELNEKASLIRKLERGDMLPSDGVQRKIERKLDISLTESAGEEDTEWSSDSDAGSYTLGDVVERKD